jgi:acyl-CoA synthetase (NDP forming)
MYGKARADELLTYALSQAQSALSEHDSKRVLAAYGVPVIDEALACDAAAAVAAADAQGYPAALKGCAPGLAHKSDRGLVRLNLADAAAVESAARQVLNAQMPAVLVQRMAAGRREIIVGGARDSVFGSYVMLGIGGTAVEAMADVSFRHPPLDDRDVREMVLELRGRRLFDAFRGEVPVSMQALAETLRAVGRILDDHPNVSHVDINPLVVEDGIPVAVDALVSLSNRDKHAVGPNSDSDMSHLEMRPTTERQFKALFEPSSIAIIGASDAPIKWGFRILFNTLEGGYRGKLYAINPKHRELLGVPCWPSVAALPEAPDLALVVIPPPAVPGALRECAAKGVKAVVVITAGFGELQDREAQSLQKEITDIARETGLLLAGPNCAGLASPAPHSLFCGMLTSYPEAGGLSLVSQSGNVGGTVMTWAQLHQVGIARFISSGNEAATRTEDYLDFFARDPRTTSILTYVEGVSDGQRFLDSLRAAAAKPVVMIKGGRSAAGLKAAQSHTGALASETRVFQAVCRQAGASIVDDSYEAMEVAAAFAKQPLPKGRRIGIVSQGGGWGVMAADACVEAGLDVPALPDDTLAELDAIMPAWWSRGNPVDLVASNDILTLLSKAVEIIIKSPAVDGVILLGIGYIAGSVSRLEKSERAKSIGLDKLAAAAANVEIEGVRHIADLVPQYGKPLMVASDTALTAYVGTPNPAIAEMERHGICVLASPNRAARVMAHLAQRYEYVHGIPRG